MECKTHLSKHERLIIASLQDLARSKVASERLGESEGGENGSSYEEELKSARLPCKTHLHLYLLSLAAESQLYVVFAVKVAEVEAKGI